VNIEERLQRPLLMKRAPSKKSRRSDRPTLPEFDQTKKSVHDSFASMHSMQISRPTLQIGQRFDSCSRLRKKR
jgi:hypothetical protein